MRTITRRTPVDRGASTMPLSLAGGCSFRSALLALLVTSALVTACLFYVWSRTEVVREGYGLSEVTKDIGQLRQEQEQLKSRVADLRSPERIESIARDRLGLTAPTQAQIKALEYAAPEPAPAPTLAYRGPSEGGD